MVLPHAPNKQHGQPTTQRNQQTKHACVHLECARIIQYSALNILFVDTHEQLITQLCLSMKTPTGLWLQESEDKMWPCQCRIEPPLHQRQLTCRPIKSSKIECTVARCTAATLNPSKTAANCAITIKGLLKYNMSPLARCTVATLKQPSKTAVSWLCSCN